MAVILAFDVPIDEDAREEAEKQNVQIFTADIIYRLTDQFNRYLDELKEAEEERRRKNPCGRVAGEDCRTNIPGLFTAGDCRTKSVRQLTTAVGDGAVAATAACELLDR